MSAFELKSLEETLDDIKAGLNKDNQLLFENSVQVHVSHITSTVSQVGTLQAFNA